MTDRAGPRWRARRPKRSRRCSRPSRSAIAPCRRGSRHRFDFSKTHPTAPSSTPSSRLPRSPPHRAPRRAVRWREGQSTKAAAPSIQPSAARARRQRRPRRRPSRPDARLVDAIEVEAFGPIRHILHIGIGGSALGPELLTTRSAAMLALRSRGRRQCRRRRARGGDHRLRSSGRRCGRRFEDFHHQRNLLKRPFRMGWMAERRRGSYGRVVALTANPEKAIEFGVDETASSRSQRASAGAIRYGSVDWLPAALALGWDAFESCLKAPRRWTAISARAARSQRAVLAAFVDLFTPTSAATRRAPCCL